MYAIMSTTMATTIANCRAITWGGCHRVGIKFVRRNAGMRKSAVRRSCSFIHQDTIMEEIRIKNDDTKLMGSLPSQNCLLAYPLHFPLTHRH